MIRLFYIYLSVLFSFGMAIGQPSIGSFDRNPPIHFRSSEGAVLEEAAFPTFIKNQTAAFYYSIHFQTFWLGEEKPFDRTIEFISVLEHSGDYGLNPSTYGYPYLAKAVHSVYSDTGKQEDLIKLDYLLTSTYLQFAAHLVDGRIENTGTANKLWVRKTDDDQEELKYLMLLEQGKSINEAVAQMHPDQPFYHLLLEKLQEIRAENGIEFHEFSFDDPTKVEIGFSDPKVEQLRENLHKRGYPVSPDSSEIDAEVVEAIKDFQESRGIKVDGIPGDNTLRYLNLPKQELERLIALNLERMRWLPDGLEDHFLWVNIPEYVFRYYKDGEEKIMMKVVAGEIVNSTPIFSDMLTHIVFNPDWTVPQSIIQKEMIPKMIENSSHYVDSDFSVYEDGEEIDPDTVDWASESISTRYFGVVQHPGASNSLGRVKFMLPNSLSIYLHDTPSAYLFERNERAFSHGCIRLEKPFELAEVILEEQSAWTQQLIQEVLEKGETKTVHLNEPIPVMITYITTWIDEEGNLRILEDIYGHDERQLAKIAQL